MGKWNAFVENIVPDAQAVFRRFPLAILMVGLFTLSLLIEQNLDIWNDEVMLGVVGGTILAAYLAVIMALIGEGRGRPIALWIKILVCAAALVGGYYFREIAFLTPVAIGASILFLGSAPFFRSARNDVGVWDFTHKLWTAVIFTVAGSVIYLIGLYSISAALKSLFGLRIDDLLENLLLPLGLGFLAPLCWLSMLPRHDEDDGDSLRNPGFISRAVGFLGTWILAPLTLIYAVILVAYGLKIVLSLTLPKGEIAQIVTPFLIIGTLTWLVLEPPFIQEKRLARWYNKIWFPLTIPAAVLLAIAVFVRINEYGWTIERYLLVLAAVWALGIAAWFTFRGDAKRDIRIIPGFAALLLAIASIGPWGASQFSAINQNARLERALIANDMLDGSGKLKPADQINIVDKEAAITGKGALSYLIDQRKARRIKAYIPDGDGFDLAGENSYNGRLDSSKIYKRFGMNVVKIPNRYGQTYNYYNYQGADEIVAIDGYEVLTLPMHVSLDRNHTSGGNRQIGAYTVISEKGDLIVRRDEEELGRFDALTWLNQQPTSDNNVLNLDPRLVLYAEDDVEIAIHITIASYNKDQEYGGSSMQFMVLAKGIDPIGD